MTKVTRRELEKAQEEFEEEFFLNPNKEYGFPKRWGRKDFPLLFPKSEADETVIRLIAAHVRVDYDGLVRMLMEAETNHSTRQDLMRVLTPLRNGYAGLKVGVMINGQDYGLGMSQYAVTPPARWERQK